MASPGSPGALGAHGIALVGTSVAARDGVTIDARTAHPAEKPPSTKIVCPVT
jgi:hypothetical protein